MHIFDDQENKESGQQKIYQSRDDFPIKDSSVRKVFHFFYSKPHKNRIEYQWSDKIIYKSFHQLTYFGGDKQSYCYAYNIILRKESEKILEHITMVIK